LELILDKHSVRINTYPKSHLTPELFIYLFISLGVLRLAWLYMTWQHCVAIITWQSRDEPTAKVAFVPLLVLGWLSWRWQTWAFIALRVFSLHKKQHR